MSYLMTKNRCLTQNSGPCTLSLCPCLTSTNTNSTVIILMCLSYIRGPHTHCPNASDIYMEEYLLEMCYLSLQLNVETGQIYAKVFPRCSGGSWWHYLNKTLLSHLTVMVILKKITPSQKTVTMCLKHQMPHRKQWLI